MTDTDDNSVSRKRRFEDDNEDTMDTDKDRAQSDNNNKRAFGKQPLLKLLVPNDAAVAIIGKRGANLVELKERYGASIRLSHNKEFYPGTNERVLVVSGEVSQIIDLNNYIIDKIHQNAAEGRNKRDKDENRGQQIKIILPNKTAGTIIGKAGATIKEIKEETKAKISITGRDESSVPGERLLTISGNTEQRIEAARQVITKIATQEDNMANTSLKYSYLSQDNSNRDHFNGMDNRNHYNDGGNMYSQNDSNRSLQNNSLSALGLGGVNKLDNLADVAQQLVGLSQLGSTCSSVEKSIKTTVQIQMEIPEMFVNSIMGPQGSNVRDFIQFSGASIRFSSANEFISGQSVRILTIHGDLNQTQIGYHLVNQKITQVRSELAAINNFQRR